LKNRDRKITEEKVRQKKCSRKIAVAESRLQICDSRIVATKPRQHIWQLQKVGSFVSTLDLHIGIVPIVAWYGIGLGDCYMIKGMVFVHGLV
jgi:hypothetical protein